LRLRFTYICMSHLCAGRSDPWRPIATEIYLYNIMSHLCLPSKVLKMATAGQGLPPRLLHAAQAQASRLEARVAAQRAAAAAAAAAALSSPISPAAAAGGGGARRRRRRQLAELHAALPAEGEEAGWLADGGMGRLMARDVVEPPPGES
jgi:hypothetical protein